MLQGDVSLMMSLLRRVTLVETWLSRFEEQCIYIKFEFYRKKNAQEINIALQEVCGNSALSYSQVARWASKDNERRGRKISGSDAYFVEKKRISRK